MNAVFQLSPKCMATTGQMPWDSTPYAVPLKCQLLAWQHSAWVTTLWNMASSLRSKPTRQEALLVKSKVTQPPVSIWGVSFSCQVCNSASHNWVISCVQWLSLAPADPWENEINSYFLYRQGKIYKKIHGWLRGGQEPLLQQDPHKKHSPSMLPEGFRDVESPGSWKSNLAAIKQPDSDILSFLTSTHPPAGLGDTWQPGQVVKIDHYKTSIF